MAETHLERLKRQIEESGEIEVGYLRQGEAIWLADHMTEWEAFSQGEVIGTPIWGIRKLNATL